MSVRLRIFSNTLIAILVLNAVGISMGFMVFWLAAYPYVGERLNENAGHIAARYFPLSGVAVLILVGVGAIWVISVTLRYVIRPLSRLKRAATEIGDGNLSYELAVSGRDEFTELAVGFEKMRVRLKDSTRAQEKAEAERRAIMASVTHDLLTPITSILGYAEGILDGVTDTPEKTREYAKIIRKKAQSLQFLAEDLSLLSRLENAQLPLDKQEEDLGVLVAELASEFSFHEADVCVETHLMSGLRVMVDREKIARVLNNLLQNSVKYKRPNLSPRVSLTLVRQRGASQPGGMALLTVSDNGIGVEQGDLPRLFDQFYRADVSRGRQSGSGLGLSIVRHLVRLHDGKIWIINNPGGGLSVNIALPLAGS